MRGDDRRWNVEERRGKWRNDRKDERWKRCEGRNDRNRRWNDEIGGWKMMDFMEIEEKVGREWNRIIGKKG